MINNSRTEKVVKFCNMIEKAERFHSDLFEQGKIIPRPLFIRRMAETDNYINENFRNFVHENDGKDIKDIIMSDEWLSWKTFDYDYIKMMCSNHLFSIIDPETHRNDDKTTFNSQRLEEANLLLETKNHKISERDAVDVLETMGNKTIGKYLVDHVYDKFTIKTFQSILDYLLESEEEDNQTVRIKIHNFINQYKRIGEDSSYGIALKASLGKFNERRSQNFSSIVVKAPISSLDSHEMIHEATIGHYLNEERDNCVNFSAVYDAYIGGAPILAEDGSVLVHSNPGEIKVAHAIYEIVNEGVSISKITDRNELLLAIINCALGLNYMNEVYDFTHYDCHDGNVMMYKYSEYDFYIKHKFENENIYVKCFGRFPMIIDYGMSHIQFKENGNIKNYGIMDSSGFASSKGIYNDMSNITSDVFKLVFMLIRKYGMIISDLNKNGRNLTEIAKCRALCLRIAGYFFDFPSIEVSGDKEIILEHEPNSDNSFGISLHDFEYIHDKMWSGRYYVRPEIFNKTRKSIKGFIKYCIDIALATIPDGISFEQPDKVLGESVKESGVRRPETETQIEQQIERQLGEMGISSVEVVSALDLYISRDGENRQRMERIFLENIEKSYRIDRDRIKKYIDYLPRYIFIVSNGLPLTSQNLEVLNLNLDWVSEFVKFCVEICDENDIIKYAMSKIAELPDYKQTSYKFTEKEIKEKMLYLRRAIDKRVSAMKTSETNINVYIFGTHHPTDENIKKFRNEGNENLVSFYDRFMNVYGSLNSIKLKSFNTDSTLLEKKDHH